MRQIDSKEFATLVDDKISEELFGMFARLIDHFNKLGYVEIDPMTENSLPDMEERTWMAAENRKFKIYKDLVGLGLAVESDGRDF